MSEPDWFESFFGEDYLEIYRDAFSAERAAAEVDGIVSLLNLKAGAPVLDAPATRSRVERIFEGRSRERGEPLHPFVRGTNFQVQVWRALLAWESASHLGNGDGRGA